MIDFDGLLYSQVHDVLGTEVTITPISSASPATLTAVDRTDGIALPGQVAGGIEVQTTHPVFRVRATALADAGLTRDDCRRATLVANGRTYRIENTRAMPTPSGHGDGEVWLFVTESV